MGGALVEVRLFGEPDLLFSGLAAGIRPGKAQAVLVALALDRGTSCSVEHLADALWPDAAPDSAHATVRTLVSRLRHIGGGDQEPTWLTRRGAGYVLDLPAGCVDTERFEALAQSGRVELARGFADSALRAFTEALALCRGRALGAVADLPFAQAAARRLDEARQDLVEDAAAAELALGCPGDAAARLEPHVAAHPLRERACASLMLALYRTGRQAEALAAYRRLRECLAEELGIDPTVALRELETAILQQRPDLQLAVTESAELPRLRAEGGRRTNLPGALTSFVGRDAETTEVARALARSRLVTIAGPGGAGKTRLALFVAARMDGFRDGVWFVDLTPLRDPALVAVQAAAAVGLDAASLAVTGRPTLEALTDLLRARQILLVLDNCEHLVDAAAALAHHLCVGAPGVTVLATSREILDVPGESVVRLAGLDPPADLTMAQVARSGAGALFCARAAESSPGFALTEANAAAVASICRSLDGIPLALELAAARVRLLGANHLAARLDGLSLGGGLRIADARHRTLTAAIAWSHDLLPEAERVVLRRLSVFPASWSMSAAEAVTAQGPDVLDGPAQGQVLDLIGRLVDKSLVLAVPDERGEDHRYRLLETIRQYAAVRLTEAGEGDAALARVRDFLVAKTVGWQELLNNADWLRWLQTEIDGLRTVLTWADARGESATVLGLTAPLWTYWTYVGASAEAVPTLERAALIAPDLDPIAAVHVRIGLAEHLSNIVGAGTPRREALLREALALATACGDPTAEAYTRFVLSTHLAQEGALPEALSHMERSITITEDLGPRFALNCSLGQVLVALYQGDLASARERLRAAVAPAVAAPVNCIGPNLLALHAIVEAAQGDDLAARASADAAVAAARASGFGQLLVMTLVRAVESALLAGLRPPPREILTELIELLQRLGMRRWVGEGLELTAAALLEGGDPRSAATVLGAAATRRTELSERGSALPVLVALVMATDAAVAGALDPDDNSAARRRGAAMDLAQSLYFAGQALAELAPAS